MCVDTDFKKPGLFRLSVELKNKRTTSPKGGKDWILVKFKAFNSRFLEKIK